MEGNSMQSYLSSVPVPTPHCTAYQPQDNGVLSGFDPRALNSFPPGYRFQPTDQELIVHYLAKKVQNQALPANKIYEVNLYRYHPEELAGMCGSRGECLYFFTQRDRKYKNGNRPNRVASGGYWKATGGDKEIKHEGQVVGTKKALVFYVGNPSRGSKTSWIMHEFLVLNPPRSRQERGAKLDNWVLCRIYKKASGKRKPARTQDLDDQVQRQEIHSDVQAPHLVTWHMPEVHSDVQDQDDRVQRQEVHSDIQAPHLVTWHMPEEDGKPYNNENGHLQGLDQNDQVQRQEIQSDVQAPHYSVTQHMPVSYPAMLSGNDGVPHNENEHLGVDRFSGGNGESKVADCDFPQYLLPMPDEAPLPSFDFDSFSGGNGDSAADFAFAQFLQRTLDEAPPPSLDSAYPNPDPLIKEGCTNVTSKQQQEVGEISKLDMYFL